MLWLALDKQDEIGWNKKPEGVKSCVFGYATFSPAEGVEAICHSNAFNFTHHEMPSGYENVWEMFCISSIFLSFSG